MSAPSAPEVARVLSAAFPRPLSAQEQLGATHFQLYSDSRKVSIRFAILTRRCGCDHWAFPPWGERREVKSRVPYHAFDRCEWCSNWRVWRMSYPFRAKSLRKLRGDVEWWRYIVRDELIS